MDAFKSIVLSGHIRNDNDMHTPNAAASKLELIPNSANQNQEPVQFSIKFTTGKFLIEYKFACALGNFMETDFARRIVFEALYVNNTMIFDRQEGLTIGNLTPIKPLLVNAFDKTVSEAISAGNLNDEELFLTNGFKAMFSAKLVSIITSWLNDKFAVIYRAKFMSLTRESSNFTKESVYIENTLNDAAVCFGINSNALGYVVEEDGGNAKLCSLFQKDSSVLALPAELFESHGTIRFVNIFPLVVRVLLDGGTLVVDEFDASIHPMALMSIVNIFHNDDINRNHAQLIFNTHNPIFLNSNLFRRDEIKFVERDDETHYSTHYSLSDFGTAGEKGVRMNDDYMKNYFISHYGAIKNIDFSPVLENLLKKETED